MSYHIDLWLDGCNLNIVCEGGAFNIGNIFPFGKFIYLKTTEATERQQLYGETDVGHVWCVCVFFLTLPAAKYFRALMPQDSRDLSSDEYICSREC